MKGIATIIAILILLFVSVSATGAAWLSVQSNIVNEMDDINLDIGEDSVKTTEGTVYIEIENTNEKPLTNEFFLPVEIRSMDNSYESSCYSDCLSLKNPLQPGESGLLFEWKCPTDARTGSISSGTYIISFKTKHKTFETVAHC